MKRLLWLLSLLIVNGALGVFFWYAMRHATLVQWVIIFEIATVLGKLIEDWFSGWLHRRKAKSL